MGSQLEVISQLPLHSSNACMTKINFFMSWAKKAPRFYGIRQVDDVLLLILAREKKEHNKDIKKVLKRFRTETHKSARPIYTGGLVLKEEKIYRQGRFYKLTFAGCQIKIGRRLEQGFHTRPYFKNIDAILSNNTPSIPRFPPRESAVNPRIITNTMKGMLYPSSAHALVTHSH